MMCTDYKGLSTINGGKFPFYLKKHMQEGFGLDADL